MEPATKRETNMTANALALAHVLALANARADYADARACHADADGADYATRAAARETLARAADAALAAADAADVSVKLAARVAAAYQNS
jgi:hypothetical protein